MRNEMHLQFSARSENESFARVTVAAFVAQLDPTIDELTEIKTVVSEAVTNAIIHGYNNDPNGIVFDINWKGWQLTRSKVKNAVGGLRPGKAAAARKPAKLAAARKKVSRKTAKPGKKARRLMSGKLWMSSKWTGSIMATAHSRIRFSSIGSSASR